MAGGSDPDDQGRSGGRSIIPFGFPGAQADRASYLRHLRDSDRPPAMRMLITVRTTTGTGLTKEVTDLLKCNPHLRHTLREVLVRIRPTASKAEVNSILHKLVHRDRRVVLGRAHNGLRFVNTYKWKLPGD